MLLFLCATGTAWAFLGGDLGQWNDDYAYDRRNVLTGQSDGAWTALLPGRTRWSYRPLYYLIVPMLETELAGAPRALHAVSLGAHIGVGILAWALLRRLGCSFTLSGIGATVFSVWPSHWQVPLWPAALPTGLAAGVFCVLALFIVWGVRRPLRIWMLPVALLLAGAIPCLNEQPAAGVLALPLLGLVARTPNDTVRTVLRRAGVLTVVALLPILLYAVLHIQSARLGMRGAADTLIKPAELGDRAIGTVRAVRGMMTMHQLRSGALVQALVEFRASPLLAAAALVSICVAWGVAAIGRGTRRSGTSVETPSGAPQAGAVFGTLVFLLNWVPVILIRQQGVESRLCYMPCLAIAVAVFCGIQSLRQRVGTHPVRRAVLAAAALPVVLGAASMSVGIQGAMRARWLRDQDQARQLRTLIHNPLPSSVLVPLSIADRPTSTGFPEFDSLLCGPLERPWSAPFYIRMTFRRPGFTSAWFDRWSAAGLVRDCDDRGLLYGDSMLHPNEQLAGPFAKDERGRKILPWDRVIPFVIDTQGQVRLVRRFTRAASDGGSIEYRPPQIAAQGLDADGVTVRMRPNDSGITIE